MMSPSALMAMRKSSFAIWIISIQRLGNIDFIKLILIDFSLRIIRTRRRQQKDVVRAELVDVHDVEARRCNKLPPFSESLNTTSRAHLAPRRTRAAC